MISPEQILQTAKDYRRTFGTEPRWRRRPTLAVGIAHVFHKIIPMADMGF
ncbi:hypothetical protein MJ390_04205 [Klebsiella pneumoniae]|nr:hypothetical protein MJ390_04205 [Klebsiella pneumoniae]